MDLEKLKAQLRRHEGLRLHPYKCSRGYWTCGYGHLLTGRYSSSTIDEMRADGITRETADKWLDQDIAEAIRIANRYYLTPDQFNALSSRRQQVIVNMAFNLGHKLLQFKALKRAILEQDWKLARLQMLSSKWATQVKGRARELADMMEDG